jgi:hypothetical protein
MRTEHHAAGETAKGGARPENPEISKAILDLKGLQRWVCWKQVPKPGKDGVIKLAKVPIALDGSSEGWTNPQKWGTLAQCLAKKKAEALNGVGFVFNGDGIVGIDIDGCRNPATGEISDWGQKIIEDINSYTEISPSGTGVKILLRTQGAVPFAKKRRELEGLPAIQGKAPGVEMFASAGYFTITGRHLSGTPKELRDATHAVTQLASWLTETERKAEAPKKEVDLNNPYTFINSKALKRPDLWVLELFPEAIAQGNGGYRVSSAALGRGLEENLSIHPQGIKDFGLHDQPDETRQGKRTAVDLVMEYGGAANAMMAARWLAEQLGLEEELEAKFAAYRTKHNAEQRKQTLEGIRQKLEAVGHDAKHLFARLILEADLTPVEEEEILALVSKLTNVGKRVLRKELEEAKRKERAHRADAAHEHDAAMMGKVRRRVPDPDGERTPVIVDVEQVFAEGAPELFQNVMGDVVCVGETKSALLHLLTSESNAGGMHADMFAPPPASTLIQAHTVESLRAVIERRIQYEDRSKGQVYEGQNPGRSGGSGA